LPDLICVMRPGLIRRSALLKKKWMTSFPPPLSEHRFYDPNLVVRQVPRLAHWDFHPSITRVLPCSCRNNPRKATRQK